MPLYLSSTPFSLYQNAIQNLLYLLCFLSLLPISPLFIATLFSLYKPVMKTCNKREKEKVLRIFRAQRFERERPWKVQSL